MQPWAGGNRMGGGRLRPLVYAVALTGSDPGPMTAAVG